MVAISNHYLTNKEIQTGGKIKAFFKEITITGDDFFGDTVFSLDNYLALKFLNKSNIPCYIATGVHQKEINELISKLKIKKFFKNIYGYPKKKDEILRIIKKSENVKYSKIYFIGDSMSDFFAAKKRKVNFLGRRTILNHREKIRKSNIGNMIGNRHPRSKLTLDLNTGIFYECLREASESLDIKYTTLKAMMQGVNKNRTNLIYC